MAETLLTKYITIALSARNTEHTRFDVYKQVKKCSVTFQFLKRLQILFCTFFLDLIHKFGVHVDDLELIYMANNGRKLSNQIKYNFIFGRK